MGEHTGKAIAVVGATGLQGRFISRHLLQQGWSVRALTPGRFPRRLPMPVWLFERSR